MILNNTNAVEYREQFVKRFTNYGDKAPILLSFSWDDFEVQVKHENSGTVYHYPWDFTITVKSFIHNIKQELSRNHYPRISRVVTTVEPLTAEEQAQKLTENVPLDQLPSSKVVEKTQVFRIDKILALKDEFILLDEETGDQYCYKMNSSSIYFLKNYREGKFKDTSEAGQVFFKKSVLVNKIKRAVECIS